MSNIKLGHLEDDSATLTRVERICFLNSVRLVYYWATDTVKHKKFLLTAHAPNYAVYIVSMRDLFETHTFISVKRKKDQTQLRFFDNFKNANRNKK